MKVVRWFWKWSPLVCLPIMVALGIWFGGTYQRWFDFEVRMRTSSDLNLEKVGRLEAERMLRVLKTSVTGTTRNRLLEESGLRTIHLYLKDGDLKRLDSNLPHSSREYVDGGMYYDGAFREVDLRYRGDNVYHWGYWKKSWRVKTKRDRLFEGMRKFNLVAPRTPEIVNNYLSLKLASKMGLIAPRVELVNVTVNGKLLGLYTLTEQLEESTIRRARRMPGDLYSGELVGVDARPGTSNNLWDSAGFWKKVAVNNHFAEESMEPLNQLIHRLAAANTEAGQDRLLELVDLESFARFSAFESLVCTTHIDDLHNWRLYYDPWHTRFVPIAWDPVGWHRSMRIRTRVPPRPDVISSRLHAALHSNGKFLLAKSRVFAQFFEARMDEYLLSELNQAIASIEPMLRLDPNIVEEGVLQSPGDVMAALEELRGYLEGPHMSLMREAHLASEGELLFEDLGDGNLRLQFQAGRVLEGLRVRLDQFSSKVPACTLHWFEGEEGKSLDISRALKLDGDGEVHIALPLLGDVRVRQRGNGPMLGWDGGLDVGLAAYELRISGLLPGARVVGVTALLDGAPLVARRAEALPHDQPMSRMFRRVSLSNSTETLTWEGERSIEGVQTIDDNVIIRPGTHLRMKPGASLLFRGFVEALGTREAPIRFTQEGRSRPEKAWGTVAIKGGGANGSQFKFCEFNGGSGLKADLYEYSAMFSIHGVQDVLVHGCTFNNNYVVDDMVHGVYSNVVFRFCTWNRSLFDALDMDISTVVVENCSFVKCGNDAIDLMTTRASVISSHITGSADKGVSIGEASVLLAIGTEIDNCGIGLQSKDDSLGLIMHSEILSCPLGVDAYKKNWRYDAGGTMHLHNVIIDQCAKPTSADSNSQVRLDDCFVTGLDPAAPPKRVSMGESDAQLRGEARSSEYDFAKDPRVQQRVGEALSRWASLSNGSVRGVVR